MADVADDHSNDCMIALLPTTSDWCTLDLPHMTLVFCGAVSDLMASDQNAMAKDALDLALACKPMTLVVMRVEVFGDDTPVEVLRLRPDPQLLAMQSTLEHWSKSEHPFNPHCTVGPVGSIQDVDIPDSLTFNRIAVAWGDSLLTYKLC